MSSSRIEALEAALNLMDEGVVLLDQHASVIFWNQAAASLTGHPAAEVVSHRCPDNLYVIDRGHLKRATAAAKAREHGDDCAGFAGAIAGYSEALARGPAPSEEFLENPVRVALHHHLGHTVPAMLRKLLLKSPTGVCIGSALLFHGAEEMDAVPHGESGEAAGIERGQADMEDRLDAAHHQWTTNRVPFGLLWVTVDQAAHLRKTHGRDACEAMLRSVEHTLLRGLRPSEVIGRWGNDEFLVLSHERTAELLGEHAHRLAGLARTADFRWWGDRVNLTASIGASQVRATASGQPDSLHLVLERAQQNMQASLQAGGNHVTETRGH
jgi:diguanylate cyclase (GGDEF)-like protein